MIHRLGRFAAIVLLVGTLFAWTVPSALAYNPGYGNCGNSSGSPFIVQDTSNNYLPPDALTGVQATIDATLAGHLCSDPGGPFGQDNGWYHGVQVFDANYSGWHGISVGIVLCDSAVAITHPQCDGANRTQPRTMFYGTECTGAGGFLPWEVDVVDVIDGTADWAAHQYRLWFDPATDRWYYYVDNVAAGYIDTTRSEWACLNVDTGNYVRAAWSSQRSDVGDGWGDTNNWVQFTGQQYRKRLTGWYNTGYSYGSNCAGNNRPYPTLHYQVCWHDGQTSSQRNTNY